MRGGGIGLVIIAVLLAIFVAINHTARITAPHTDRYFVIVGAVLGIIGVIMFLMSMRGSATKSVN